MGLFRFWSDFCPIRLLGSIVGDTPLLIARVDQRLSGACWNRVCPAVLVSKGVRGRIRHRNWQPKLSTD